MPGASKCARRSPERHPERPRPAARRRPENDARDDKAAERAAVDELGDAGAVRQELESPGAEGRHGLALVDEDELERAAAETLRDVAAIGEPERKESRSIMPPDRERLRLEPVHEEAGNAHEDDDADPEENVDAPPRRRPGREQEQRRMIAGSSGCRRRHGQTQSRHRVRGKPEPPWAGAKPVRRAARLLDARSSAEGAREAGASDRDDEPLRARVPHGDLRARPSFELDSQRAGAQPRPRPGRRSGDGRARDESCRNERDGGESLHPAITVYVSVAV